MAKKIQTQFSLFLIAGKATPAPPVGPMLWQHWINIGQFTKDFNEKTSEMMKTFQGVDVRIPVDVKVFIDRSFEMELGSPVSSDLIKWKSKVKKGSWEPNTKKVWTLSSNDIKEIAEIKKTSMNTDDLDSIVKSLCGTAKSMGINIQ